MGEWHRDNPEMTGTEADPWTKPGAYRLTDRGRAAAKP